MAGEGDSRLSLPGEEAHESGQIFLRRTELTDAARIATLVDDQTEELFGESNVVSVIERAVLSISVVDQDGVVVGHASFFDYPNVEGVRSSAWQEWMAAYYDTDVLPVNSLFLRLLVAVPGSSPAVLRELLHTVFVAVPSLQYCALPVPAGATEAVETVGLGDFFSPAKVVDRSAEGQPVQPTPADSSSIFVCHRSNLLPFLGLRVAVAEDNDDLAGIFARQNETLHQRFGEFYLNDLIEAQDSRNKALAIEADGSAVGLMSLSTNVDTTLLQKHYQLDVFHGLQSLRPAQDAEDAGLRPSSARVPPAGRADGEMDGETEAEAADEGEEALVRRPGGKEKEDLPMAMTDSVISIGLFAIAEEHEMRSMEFLRLAFSLFPGKDYCICSLPHNMPVFPLLHNFTRVPQAPQSTLPHELYIFHRYGLLEELCVRAALPADIPAMSDGLMRGMEHNDVIVADVTRAAAEGGGRDPDGVKVEAYVATVHEKIVGVAVVRDARRDALLMRSHFNIEDFVLFGEHMPREHANLHHFRLNPIFNRLGKTFLREVMRLSEKTCVYHRLYTPGTAPKDRPVYTHTPLLADMIPVRRRRQPLYPDDALQGNVPSDRVRALGPPFALAFLNRKLMLEPKLAVNQRVVVVGASDTALACLQTLVYKPHLSFNNITLLSRGGYTLPAAVDPILGNFLSTSHCFSADEAKQTALPCWVNIVDDTMLSIDRKAKLLHLASGDVLPYDILVLAPGKQYQPSSPEQPAPPRRVEAVSNEADVGALMAFLKSTCSDTDGTLLVYGAGIDSYSAIYTLLQAGFAGSRIALVTRVDAPPCFPDANVQEAVEKTLHDAGVTIHTGLTVTGWTSIDGTDDQLEAAWFSTGEEGAEPVQMPCEVFVNLDEKMVDETTFQAVNNCFLVFDGGLVVDGRFRTNDASIFAAGPFTKYPRRFHTEELPEQFASREVGEALGRVLLSALDPLAGEPDGETDAVPSYEQPVVTGAVLGGLSYLLVARPGTVDPADSQLDRHLVTSTTDPDGSPRFFRITIDEHGAVAGLACLAKAATLETSNYLCLFGLNNLYLNNLVSRFDEGLIEDFFTFFHSEWAVAIFHDRFGQFVDKLQGQIRSKQEVVDSELSTLAADLHELRIKRKGLDKSQEADSEELLQQEQKTMQKLVNIVDTPACGQQIKDRLMDFLGYNSHHLPMYARPMAVDSSMVLS